ncbi:hypothetical protein QVD99_008512 [Batrachochytrium dendrobatidis]|nr:hypothetical protein QVD99_008512 [Batrachochytrium dendrobatidis]
MKFAQSTLLILGCEAISGMLTVSASYIMLANSHHMSMKHKSMISSSTTTTLAVTSTSTTTLTAPLPTTLARVSVPSHKNLTVSDMTCRILEPIITQVIQGINSIKTHIVPHFINTLYPITDTIFTNLQNQITSALNITTQTTLIYALNQNVSITPIILQTVLDDATLRVVMDITTTKKIVTALHNATTDTISAWIATSHVGDAVGTMLGTLTQVGNPEFARFALLQALDVNIVITTNTTIPFTVKNISDILTAVVLSGFDMSGSVTRSTLFAAYFAANDKGNEARENK